MKITHIAGITPDELADAIRSHFEQSRFSIRELHINKPRFALPWLNLKKIRLKSSKDYCGSHPAACERVGSPHNHTKFLEGADWVEFNDTLNNLCDKLKVSACILSSSPEFRGPMVIRLGMHRRQRYGSEYPNEFRSPIPVNQRWIGHEPENMGLGCTIELNEIPTWSDFPEGTPGIHNGRHYQVEG